MKDNEALEDEVNDSRSSMLRSKVLRSTPRKGGWNAAEKAAQRRTGISEATVSSKTFRALDVNLTKTAFQREASRRPSPRSRRAQPPERDQAAARAAMTGQHLRTLFVLTQSI